MAHDLASERGDPLARGVAIGRYVVLGLVGRGAMGEVYAAHDPELNRKVAIKLLHPKAGATKGDNEDRLSLMREAQSIARLSHPNVVVIHDVGSFRDTVFIAMEFVEGHTLRYWMHAQTRRSDEILKVFAAAGSGLVAAHEKELVHRDFKPDNVMIRKDGQVRVMDFGLAGTIDQGQGRSTGPTQPVLSSLADSDNVSEDLYSTRVLTVAGESSGAVSAVALRESNSPLGTPAYMAPEQFEGKQTDARGDQFSFCVALYEALYGERPFHGETLLALSTSVTGGNVREPPLNTHVPLWIRKVLLRGLMVNPDDRWPTMSTLLSGLDDNARRLAEIDEWLEARCDW